MPSKSLPSSPSLDHLKYQAKDLLNAHNAGNPEALARVKEFHPKFACQSDPETQSPKFSLSDAQLVVAREYGFESWPKLKQHVQSLINRAAHAEEAVEFFDAVRRLNVEDVRRLLAKNPALVHARVLGDARLTGAILPLSAGQSKARQSCTALHFAVRHAYDAPAKVVIVWRGDESYVDPQRHEELARTLLEHGADPNAVGWNGDEDCTPLELAAWEGTLTGVQLLLDHGADPNRNLRRRSRGSSALYTAAEHGDRLGVCELLLRHGAKPGVHSAAMLGLADALAKLLNTDPALIYSRDFRNRTPLDAAVQLGRTEAAELLIQRGAGINLVQAAGLGMLDRVRQFVQTNPSSVNPTDGCETPLMAAARNEKIEVMKFLLDHGANVHLGQKEHLHTMKPIHVAYAAAVPLLVKAGADVNEPYRGYTPLQRAVRDGNLPLALALAARGGTKRFYLVGHIPDAQLAEQLLSLTPVRDANFPPRVLEQLPQPLVVVDPDVNETDEHGKTALDYAIENQNRHANQSPAERFAELAETLRQHGGRCGSSSECVRKMGSAGDSAAPVGDPPT